MEDCNGALSRTGRTAEADSDLHRRLLGFYGDELSEVGRRAWKCGGAQLAQPRLHLGIGENCIDLFVEHVKNLGRRVFRRADAGPEARLVAWHEFIHGTSGSAGERVAVVTASTRSLPALIYSIDEDMVGNITCVYQVDVGHHLEQFTANMGRGTGAAMS
jgi:hypothetical protein